MAKKPAQPEEPDIEAEKCKGNSEYDAAGDLSEQNQRVDFLWLRRVVVELDLIARLHHRQADVATAALPGIGLSADDVSDRPVGIRKRVLGALRLRPQIDLVMSRLLGDPGHFEEKLAFDRR